MKSKTAKPLAVLRSSSTGDNLNEFTSNDGLTGTVEQDLELGDHVTGVLGSVLCVVSICNRWIARDTASLTSMAFRRADCSQA